MLAPVALLLAATAPASPASIEQQVRAADASFWQAFNACDRKRMASFLAPDVEFYHDKTGATLGRDRVVASFMNGPCGTPGLHLRRAAIDETVKFDPVPGYGAILTGRHRFYEQIGDQPERLSGEAQFAVVWRDTDGEPKMSRVLSFAHGPARPDPIVGEIHPDQSELRRFVGRYATPQGDVVVALKGDGLILDSGGLHLTLAAIGPTTFQGRERALRFDFPSSGTIEVREGGKIVASGKRQD